MLRSTVIAIAATSLAFTATAQEPVATESETPTGVVLEETVVETTVTTPETPVLAEPAPIDPPADAFMTIPVDPLAAPTTTTTTTTTSLTETSPTASASRDFMEEDLSTALRLLARQARINMVVSDAVIGTITLRLENVTPMEAIRIIVTAKSLILDEADNVYYVKTSAERAAEPTEAAFYTLSYARAEDIATILQSQLQSGAAPTVDVRTNTLFYREARSNMAAVNMFLDTVDRPTKQVMIEARLIEVTANPRQAYGINWSGVFDNKTFKYGFSPFPEVDEETGLRTFEFENENGEFQLNDGLRFGESGGASDVAAELGNAALGRTGQFAILSLPQLSATMSLINNDADAEFLAHPRVVTADNQEATIKITRNQPVPQLNFNEQTATAVFGGFEDKEFGNTLVVRPSINKDDFITLSVKPEISNKVRDEVFVFAGATVTSPVIDTRSLESNVLIRSGDTLAIGGLLQEESGAQRTKVPVLGDIPLLGYLFQERVSARDKRNLLVFVTPTILEHGQGTGLENQANGLFGPSDEFADPDGWRNNAKGAFRFGPDNRRSIAADYPIGAYPVPGQPVMIDTKTTTTYRSNVPSRE